MRIRSSLLWLSVLLTACGGSGGGDNSQVVGAAAGSSGAPVSGGGGAPVGGGGSFLQDGLFDFDTGIGGSGAILGAVSGFGSIFVNGLEVGTDDAAFFIENSSGAQSDLREGQRVVVTGDLGSLEAEEVYYRANVKGPVTAAPVAIDLAVGRATFIVLGQTVQTNAETIFHGVSVDLIAQGDLLEVSGSIDANGHVIATYVELETSLAQFKAIGTVANLDSGSRAFDIGGLVVDYANARLSDFDGDPLENGQLVEVKIDPATFAAPPRAEASEVELLPTPVISEGAEIDVEGLIDAFVSASDFSVVGIPITTNSDTEYVGGDVGSLAFDVKVEVEGTANANGVIVAEEIEIKETRSVRAEGTVSAVDQTAGTVTVLGVTFEVRPFTELEDDSDADLDPLALADFLIGVDRLEVRGFVAGSTVVAVEIEREEPVSEALLRGPVTAFDEALGTLEIQGVTLRVDGGTSFEGDDDDDVGRATFFAQLSVGSVLVSAHWNSFSSLADSVDELSLEDD